MGLDLAERWGGGGALPVSLPGKGYGFSPGRACPAENTASVPSHPPLADTASPVEFQGVERQTRNGVVVAIIG